MLTIEALQRLLTSTK